MNNFSGTIKLGDLSDFIAPSQACVVKLDGGKVTLDSKALGEVITLCLHLPISLHQFAPGASHHFRACGGM